MTYTTMNHQSLGTISVREGTTDCTGTVDLGSNPAMYQCEWRVAHVSITRAKLEITPASH